MRKNILKNSKKKTEYCQKKLKTNNIAEYFSITNNIVKNIVCHCWLLSLIVHDIVKWKIILYCTVLIFVVMVYYVHNIV